MKVRRLLPLWAVTSSYMYKICLHSLTLLLAGWALRIKLREEGSSKKWELESEERN